MKLYTQMEGYQGLMDHLAELPRAGYTSAALVCNALVQHVNHPWSLALRLGLVTGLATGIGQAITPLIEYYADRLPERRLGAFGIGIILCGFALQSVQYWLALFDVHLT